MNIFRVIIQSRTWKLAGFLIFSREKFLCGKFDDDFYMDYLFTYTCTTNFTGMHFYLFFQNKTDYFIISVENFFFCYSTLRECYV